MASSNDMKKMSTFEQLVLKFMLDEWSKEKYCNARRILENTIMDFRLEFTNKNEADERVQRVFLYTSPPTDKEKGEFEERDPNISPYQFKLTEKFGKLLAVYNLIAYLDDEDFIVLNENQLPFPGNIIYGSRSVEKDLDHRMPIAGELLKSIIFYHNARIFPEQDLSSFIDSGFMTDTMMIAKRDAKARLFEQVIALISLLSAVAMGIISAVRKY